MAVASCSASSDTVYDVAVIGGGPNALRLLSCLRDQKLKVVAFEKEKVGHTIAQWYDGSVSHSARHTFQVGELQPTECKQCLESVWEGTYDHSDAAATKKCQFDAGRMHCGRDEYMAYLQRVVQAYGLSVCEHQRVLSIDRLVSPSGDNRSTLFQLTTNRTDPASVPARNSTYKSNNVVLAFGAISYPRSIPLPRAAGAQVAKVLGPSSDYSGKHVVVLGSGPSGMETAVRLCTSAYNAAHVTLASRSSRLLPAWNLYLNESLWRIRSFVESGLMTLMLQSTMSRANETHATLQKAVKSKRGWKSVAVDVRADLIITALGFTSDESLIRTAGFPDGLIKRDTCETSQRGLFNVGISGVKPWTSKADGKILSTFIEDSTPMVRKVCKAVVARVRASHAADSRVQAAPAAYKASLPAAPAAVEPQRAPAGPLVGVRSSVKMNCSSTLGGTVHDKPPERTAFAVMDYVGAQARGLRFVELGSAHGDVIECVSHVSATAASIENDPNYCKVLEVRARASSGRWHLICAAFPTPLTPKADVYFGWMYTHLNVPFLKAFRTMQLAGEIPSGASLLLAFSDGKYKRWNHPVEHNCFRMLRPLAVTAVDVPFNEGPLRRQSGIVHVATFVPALLDVSALDKAMTCCGLVLNRCNETRLNEQQTALELAGGRLAEKPGV